MESEASAGEALSLSGGWVDLGAQRGAEVAKGSNLSAAVPAGPEVDVQEERDNQVGANKGTSAPSACLAPTCHSHSSWVHPCSFLNYRTGSHTRPLSLSLWQGDVHAPLESQGWLSTSLPAGPMPPQPVQETAVPRTRPSAALPLVLLAVVIACMAAAGLKWTKQPPGELSTACATAFLASIPSGSRGCFRLACIPSPCTKGIAVPQQFMAAGRHAMPNDSLCRK